MYYLQKLLNIIVCIAIPLVISGQSKIKSSNYLVPKSCSEIEFFGESILDSSIFFKNNAFDVAEKVTNDLSLKECDYYPLLLTINGFQNYIKNDVIKSRELLLAADSLYQISHLIQNKYNIRNKIFLGLNYNIYGDTTKAISYYNTAIQLCLEANNYSLLSDVKHNLGNLYLKSGNLEKAKFRVEEAIQLANESKNLEILGFAYSTYGRILKELDSLDAALNYILESKNIFTQLNDQGNLYLVDLVKAEVLIENGEKEKAIVSLLEAESRGNKSDHKFQHGLIYKYLGDLYQDKNYKVSLEYYEKAQKYYAGLSKEDHSFLIDKLSKSYVSDGNIRKLDTLVDKLLDFQNRKEIEREIEVKETINRELLIQQEYAQNEILQLKNIESSRRIRLITIASLLLLLLSLYALHQWKKNKELNDKVNKQNEKLNSQNVELKNFASIASHDLKAPVRSITSFSSLLERLLPQSSDPKLFKYVDIIKSSSLRMDSLVNSLLQFSTLENLKLEKVPIDPDILITEVTNSLHSVIELKKAKISISKNLPRSIVGDKTLLSIVFQNLINNALKFVDEDKAPIVRIEYENDNSFDVFKFVDNGIGIEQKYLDKIFLIFERLHSSSEFEGSGIGLATCKKIIDIHNGKIDIESEVGIGSTFIISLPKNTN